MILNFLTMFNSPCSFLPLSESTQKRQMTMVVAKKEGDFRKVRRDFAFPLKTEFGKRDYDSSQQNKKKLSLILFILT